MSQANKDTDPRTAATGTIAGCGVAALALCMIFGRTLAGGIFLPVLVIAGSALAISAVWKYGGRKLPGPESAIAKLEERIVDLEERLEAAETVEAFEDRLATKEAKLRIEAASDPNQQPLEAD